MQGQRGITLRAFGNVSTRAAEHIRGGAAPVQEQDGLFAALQHHATQCPTALALSDSQRQVDYAQLWREVEARAEQLRALQVPLLALALNNCCEALIWDLAALRAGVAVAVRIARFELTVRGGYARSGALDFLPPYYASLGAGYRF